MGRLPLPGKVLPPPQPPYLVSRPRLLGRLDAARERRLILVLAGPGYGKTALLTEWAGPANAAWYTMDRRDVDPVELTLGLLDAVRVRVPGSGLGQQQELLESGRGPGASQDPVAHAGALSAELSGALETRLSEDLYLVIDDVDTVPADSGGLRLLEGLIRQAPSHLHLLLAAREEPNLRLARLRGQGQVLEIPAPELAFTQQETAAALRDGDRGADDRIARQVHDLTGGWPAAVRLVADALAGIEAGPAATAGTGGDVLASLHGAPEEAITGLLAEEVLPRASERERAVLRAAVTVGSLTPAIADALGEPGDAEVVTGLVRRGLLTPDRTHDGWVTIAPLVAHAVERTVTPAPDATASLEAAARVLEDAGDPAAALRLLTERRATDAVTGLLERCGDLLATRAPGDVLRAVGGLPAAARTPAVVLAEGRARFATGDWDGALRALADAESDLSPAGALARGLILYLRTELDDAITAFETGLDANPDDRERALLASWLAAAWWIRGDRKRCAERVEEGLQAAYASRASDALAAAHTAAAMLAAMDGDRRENDSHYLQALSHAERAGDALQLIRIRTNRGSRLSEEGRHRDALVELDEALRLADLTGGHPLLPLILANRGDALRRLGRLDEAARDLEAARDAAEAARSRMVSYALGDLGDIYLEQGLATLARSCYEEAIRISRPVGDAQGMAPALAGLAIVVNAEDPDLADDLLTQAMSYPDTLARVEVLTAVAKAALERGDLERARDHAVQAGSLAASRRDREGLAWALLLEAEAIGGAPVETGRLLDPELDPPHPGPDEATLVRVRDLLAEAESLWEAVGDPLGVARVQVSRAALDPDAPADRLLDQASEVAIRLGARRLLARIAAVRDARQRRTGARVTIMLLGGLRVEVEGQAVPHSAWQSKRARELLRILAVRRGQPVAREVLTDLLWPDAGGAAGNRLSVALSTLRGVLDPDRAHPADQYVAADTQSAWLRLEHVDLDLDRFLRRAEEGLHGHADDMALAALREAESLYTGELCEDEPYADWLVEPREHARSTYVAVARRLAEDNLQQQDADGAVRLLLRLLARDEYDERAHLELVRALGESGRHGDARRMYRRYVARMEELGVEPAPLATTS